jgi:hypothetical protein
MSGKQNFDVLMKRVIKVSPEELKGGLEAEKEAKRPVKTQDKREPNV